jgi:hypothetical protein
MTEEQKREEWERIKKDDPALAEAMKLHIKVFGKPQAALVVWGPRDVT